MPTRVIFQNCPEFSVSLQGKAAQTNEPNNLRPGLNLKGQLPNALFLSRCTAASGKVCDDILNSRDFLHI
jgi:hypothetical protein